MFITDDPADEGDLGPEALGEGLGLLKALGVEAATSPPGRLYVQALRVAAHLYAVAHYLWRMYGDSDMGLSDEPRSRTWAEVFEQLRQAQVGDGVELYTLCVDALQILDQGFAGDEFIGWQPSPIPLQAVQHWPGLGEQVVASVRPPSAWARLRRRRNDEVPERNLYSHGPADALEHLSLDVHVKGQPRVECIRGLESIPLVAASGRYLEQRKLRVALCPLLTNAGPRFQVAEPGKRFTVSREKPIQERAVLEAHLRALMKMAAREEVHLLAVPELSLDESLRDLLLEVWKQYPSHPLLAIIAGSFHVWRKDQQKPVNEAAVLSRGGKLWVHSKRGKFRLLKKHILRAHAAGIFDPLPATVADEVKEGIRYGSVLRVLDTSLGRLCVVICADVLEPPSPYRRLILDARPDLVFIVSMSPKTDGFHRFAEDMGQANISVLFLNAAQVCPEGQELAFAYLDFAQGRNRPATRVRWTQGSNTLGLLAPDGKPVQQAQVTAQQAGAFLAPEGAFILELGSHV